MARRPPAADGDHGLGASVRSLWHRGRRRRGQCCWLSAAQGWCRPRPNFSVARQLTAAIATASREDKAAVPQICGGRGSPLLRFLADRKIIAVPPPIVVTIDPTIALFQDWLRRHRGLSAHDQQAFPNDSRLLPAILAFMTPRILAGSFLTRPSAVHSDVQPSAHMASLWFLAARGVCRPGLDYALLAIVCAAALSVSGRCRKRAIDAAKSGSALRDQGQSYTRLGCARMTSWRWNLATSAGPRACCGRRRS